MTSQFKVPVGRKSRFARHPVRWLALVLSLGLLATIGIAEFLLSFPALSPAYQIGRSIPFPARHIRLREWQPNIDFIAAPPKIRRLNPGGPVHDIYQLSTDGNGFIKPSRIHKKPDATIVFLGGSTTETMFVSEEQRFPYLTGRLLEKRSGIRVNSYNGGKSGNNVLHSIFLLNAKVLPMSTDVVILMHAANDLLVLSSYGSYWPKSSDFGHVLTPKQNIETVVKYLRNITIPQTYWTLRGLMAAVDALVPIGTAWAADSQTKTQALISADLWGQDFRKALTQFVLTAQTWGVRPVLMTQVVETKDTVQPMRDDGGNYLAAERLSKRGFSADAFASSHQFFNAVIRDVGRRTGAQLIDLAVARHWSRAELYDGLHLNDNGSKVVAGLVADALEPVLIDITNSKKIR